MKNIGKQFEDNFKKSISDDCLLIRLPDPPQSFTQRSDTKFSNKNPCDFIIFETRLKTLYAFELKTTKFKSMSFENIHTFENKSKMIHKHQILGLLKFSEYKNVIAGFILNFRDEQNNTERTYFQDIKDFVKMCNSLNKSSFNEIDLLLYNAKKIAGKKKRIHFKWDIGSLLETLKTE